MRDLLVALENAEIHNERLTGQCFLDPKSQKEEAPVPQPALKLQKNCCAAIDRAGNVNVSKLDGTTVGPGGFIDIAQTARKVVFCGTFDAKGPKFRTGQGKLEIVQPGKVRKFVEAVDQVTFSGIQALLQNQEVLYVTERAVFRLTHEGLLLVEIAPGIEVQHDIIEQMDFLPIMPQPPAVMDPQIFMDPNHG